MKTFILFILMIAVLIAIHEFGHMIVGKMFNFYVREFAIGIGPKLFGIKGKETEYTVRAIPLGGFTGFVETEEENIVEQTEQQNDNSEDIIQQQEVKNSKTLVPLERTFYGAKPFKRILVCLAGPLFNILLAIFIFSSIFIINGQIVEYPAAVVGQVVENSSAMQAGIEVGDEIVKVKYKSGDVVNIKTSYDLAVNNELHNYESMTLTLNRKGNLIEVDVTPTFSQQDNAYLIGVVFANNYTIKELTFFQAIKEGIVYTFDYVGLTFKSVFLLLKGTLGLDSFSGTIGMYSYTQEAVSLGLTSYLSLCGSISVSLAVMNLLPIPVLDGGRILLAAVEMVIGHRLDKKIEERILLIGAAIMIGIMILAAYSDISKLFS